MFGRKTALGLLTGALVTTAVVGGGAAVWAASAKPTQPDGVIQACVGRHGILRLALHGCHGGEGLISWNQQGPAGPAGPGLNPTTLQSVQTPTTPPTELVPSTTFVPLPGLSLSLAPGTYQISVDLRGVINNTGANGCALVGQLASGPTLATATTPIPGSQRLVGYTVVVTPNFQVTAPIQVIYTATAPTVVQVQAARNVGNVCGAGTGIATDVNGSSVISAVRIA